MAEAPIHVVGLLGGRPVGRAAEAALAHATVVIGSADQLALVADAGFLPTATGAELLELGRGLEAIDALSSLTAPACVLASGDPGCFGIVRTLAARFGRDRLVVHPAPSSVSLAFARLALPWDDAVVVSAHTRELSAQVPALLAAPKAAVLVGPAAPPEQVGSALVAAGARHQHAAVCTRLGEPGEAVAVTDLPGLAAGRFDSRSVVVLWSDVASESPAASWGRDTDGFAHRASMITKPEVRAAVLGRLDLPATGVLWDLGSGSGSVAVEAALAAPGLRVVAVERRPDDAARIRANAASFGALVEVIEADALDVMDELGSADRIFVGGGGLSVLDRALVALKPGGAVVATFAAVDRAAEAHARLGHLVQVSVDRAEPLPGGGIRMAADNPVFVAWHVKPLAGSVAVGVGCSTGATDDDLRALVDVALAGVHQPVGVLATIDRRATHPAVTGLARCLRAPVRAYPSHRLARVDVPNPSAGVAEQVGSASVAEAAALLAAGPDSELVVTKQRSHTATVAVATSSGSTRRGALAVVGLGPGSARHRTAAAVDAVRSADVVVGYGPYVDQAADLLRPDQRVLRSGMGDEAHRAVVALEEAAGGAMVALVSSGDPGIYAMASVALELAPSVPGAGTVDIEVIPGVTAASAAAAATGAPLAHDHVAISLSDLLTPWELIERRVAAAAEADLAVAFYNPRSKGRPGHLDAARTLLLGHRSPATPVAVVTDACRPGQATELTTLGELDVESVGMGTIVLVGSSATLVLGGRMITPRNHPVPAEVRR